MKRSELVDVLDMTLQALPSGIVVNGNTEPSQWSVGYYNGFEMALRTAISLIQEIDTLD